MAHEGDAVNFLRVDREPGSLAVPEPAPRKPSRLHEPDPGIHLRATTSISLEADGQHVNEQDPRSLRQRQENPGRVIGGNERRVKRLHGFIHG
jgi:hypothetical protein